MKKNLLSFSIALILLLTFGFKNIRAYKHVENTAPTELREYGTYTIAATDKRLIEVSGEVMQGDKLKDGAKIVTSQLKMNKIERWQKWLISKQANGYYTIMNLYSGKYLGADPYNYNIGPNIPSQSRGYDNDYKYWEFELISGRGYIIKNKINGLLLTRIKRTIIAPVTGKDIKTGRMVTAIPFDEDYVVLEKKGNNYNNTETQLWDLNNVASDSYRDDAVVGFFQRTTGSTAFDEGASIPLSYGPNKNKVIWLTGDTFYNQIDEKGEFACNLIFPYHNAALLQPADHSWDPTKTANITSPDGVQIFHTDNPKNLLWPGVGIEIGNHVYVHCIEVITGTLNTVNQYLADVTETGTTSVPPVKLISVPNVSGQTKLIYSLGMVNPGDGFIYTYGTGGYFGASVYVARFPVTHPTQWTFWDGKTWASKPTDAPAAVIGKGPVNNNTVGYVNGKYVLITMDYGFTCDVPTRNMYAAVSTSPTGPFINKRIVYVLPDYKQGHAPSYYNPTIHAEFNNGHNELLVNYCINFYNTNDRANTTCLTPCSNPDGSEDPNDYRPKGVRIPFSLIGL